MMRQASASARTGSATRCSAAAAAPPTLQRRQQQGRRSSSSSGTQLARAALANMTPAMFSSFHGAKMLLPYLVLPHGGWRRLGLCVGVGSPRECVWPGCGACGCGCTCMGAHASTHARTHACGPQALHPPAAMGPVTCGACVQHAHTLGPTACTLTQSCCVQQTPAPQPPPRRAAGARHGLQEGGGGLVYLVWVTRSCLHVCRGLGRAGQSRVQDPGCEGKRRPPHHTAPLCTHSQHRCPSWVWALRRRCSWAWWRWWCLGQRAWRR